MSNVFFDLVPTCHWTPAQRSRLSKRFTGKASDWRKKSLRWARDLTKARLLAMQHYRCAYCRMLIEDNLGKSEIDHVIAKELAPQFCYTPVNLVLCCKLCNANKGKRNVTKFSDTKLKGRKNYSHSMASYAWVHPYYDEYSSHIEINGDVVFSAKLGSSKGLAVIEACKLDRVREVVARQRRAVALGSKTALSAVLSVCADNSKAPVEELVATLVMRPDLEMSESEVRELVIALRSSTPIKLLRLVQGV